VDTKRRCCVSAATLSVVITSFLTGRRSVRAADNTSERLAGRSRRAAYEAVDDDDRRTPADRRMTSHVGRHDIHNSAAAAAAAAAAAGWPVT